MKSFVDCYPLAWEFIFTFLDVESLFNCYFVSDDFQEFATYNLKSVCLTKLLPSLRANARSRYVTMHGLINRQIYFPLIFNGYYYTQVNNFFSCAECQRVTAITLETVSEPLHSPTCSFTYKEDIDLPCKSTNWYIYHPFRKKYFHSNFLKRYLKYCYPWIRTSLTFKKKFNLCALRVNFKFLVTKSQILSEFNDSNQIKKKVSTSNGLELVFVPGNVGWNSLSKDIETRYCHFSYRCSCNHFYAVYKRIPSSEDSNNYDSK